LKNRQNTTLLQWDASTVVYTGKICDPDPPNPNNDPNIQSTQKQWLNFNEFVVDGDGTCSSLTNYGVQLPGKLLGSFDPLKNVGATITVVGMLRNNSGQNPYLDPNGMTIPCDDVTNICQMGACVDGICKKGAFNFWTIAPRTPADVTVQ